jgi:phosphatidate cytidylyltransferase
LAADNSLYKRTLTALVLGPLVMGAVLWLPTPGLALFLSLVVLGGALEWAGLAGLSGVAARAAYLVGGACLMGLLWVQPALRFPLMVIGAVWWLLQGVQLARVRRIDTRRGLDLHLLLTGLPVLIAPWAALVHLHQIPAVGPRLVLALLLLIWTADSAAYFVGRRWGRVKLAPLLSPGKTRAGLYGALAGALVAALLLAWALSLTVWGTLLVVLVCGVTVLLSVVGDLYESLQKRRRGLKDSGKLLPGHGGLLDRVDSLTAAAPVFALGISFIVSL